MLFVLISSLHIIMHSQIVFENQQRLLDYDGLQ